MLHEKIGEEKRVNEKKKRGKEREKEREREREREKERERERERERKREREKKMTMHPGVCGQKKQSRLGLYRVYIDLWQKSGRKGGDFEKNGRKSSN